MSDNGYILSMPQFMNGVSGSLGYVKLSASDTKEAIIEKVTLQLRLNRKRCKDNGYIMGQPVMLAALDSWDHDKVLWIPYQEIVPICPIDMVQDKEAYKVPILGKVTANIGDIVIVTNCLHGHSWEIAQRVLIVDIETEEEEDRYYTVRASDFPSLADYNAAKDAYEDGSHDDDDYYEFDPEMYWLSRGEFQLSD